MRAELRRQQGHGQGQWRQDRGERGGGLLGRLDAALPCCDFGEGSGELRVVLVLLRGGLRDLGVLRGERRCQLRGGVARRKPGVGGQRCSEERGGGEQ